jgi:hypothetical protein
VIETDSVEKASSSRRWWVAGEASGEVGGSPAGASATRPTAALEKMKKEENE